MTLRKYDALVKRFSDKLERQDVHVAQLSAALYNANGVKRKGGNTKAWNVSDFMKRASGNLEKMPWQDQLKMVEMLNAKYGGTDKRKING